MCTCCILLATSNSNLHGPAVSIDIPVDSCFNYPSLQNQLLCQYKYLDRNKIYLTRISAISVFRGNWKLWLEEIETGHIFEGHLSVCWPFSSFSTCLGPCTSLFCFFSTGVTDRQTDRTSFVAWRSRCLTFATTVVIQAHPGCFQFRWTVPVAAVGTLLV